MGGALSLRKPSLYRSRPAVSDCADQGGEALDVEARAPDQAPVHVRFAKKLGDVVRLDAPAIQDAALLRSMGAGTSPVNAPSRSQNTSCAATPMFESRSASATGCTATNGGATTISTPATPFTSGRSSRTNTTASRTVLNIFQLPAMTGVRI